MKYTSSSIISIFKEHGDNKQRQALSQLIKTDLGRRVLVEIATGPYNISTRRWAIEGCASSQGRSCALITKKALSDSSMTVRLHAILGIRSSRIKSRYKWVEQCLFDESGGIRRNAFELLESVMPSAITRNIEILANDEKKYIRDKVKAFIKSI